jgi:hypothetical protein
VKRDEWYFAYTLAVFAAATLFDGHKWLGTGILLVSVAIVVAVDGFKVKI